MGKNKLKDDIDDVFSGWAVSQKAKENPELYEPGKGKDSPPTRAKDQNRGAKLEGLKQTVKNTPSETSVQTRTFKDPSNGRLSITRRLRLSTTFQRRTSFSISMRSMMSFYLRLIRQPVCLVSFSASFSGNLMGTIRTFVRCPSESLSALLARDAIQFVET